MFLCAFLCYYSALYMHDLDDGSFGVYGSTGQGRGEKWSTNTSGHTGAVITLQCEGNLVIYDVQGQKIRTSSSRYSE